MLALKEPQEKSVSWVYRGDLLSRTPHALFNQDANWDGSDEALFQRKGLVRLSVSDRGTEVCWSMFACNWASLFLTMEWIRTAPGPYKLKYFIVGWAEETYDNAADAADRISQLLAKSDVHLTTRTFVKEADPGSKRLPEVIHQTLLDGAAIPDISVDCILDDATGKFNVERIGAASTLAQMWGLSPVSYPCRSGHSFAQMVSQAYAKVLKTDEPHYDHIYAALESTEREVFWLPYQRVVLPHRFPDRRKGVTVVTAVGDVDIAIV